MLYKYLFYSVSYLVKKYDRFWDVGETYYIYGAILVGGTIGMSLTLIIDLIGILFLPELLGRTYPIYITPLCAFPLTIYWGITGKHIKIYNEVANLNPKKKRIYKILNIIHLLVVYGSMNIIGTVVRNILINQ